jgi:hypothetical protein
MDLNRNQFLLIGLVVLLLGLQLKMVDTYVLNAKTSEIIAKRMADKKATTFQPAQMYLAAQGPPSLRRVEPPKWIGYSLLSVGAVLVLHALSMKKPGG